MTEGRTDAFSLAGRVAVVTGAGGGLGEGICLRLAAAGAAVACVGRTRDSIDAIRDGVIEAGGTAISVLCDVADQASVEAMAADVVRQLGGIDVLVNNAAIYPRRVWTEITKEEWDRVLGTNLTGYFLCARAVFPYLKERGRGRIINMASITFFGGWGMLLDYVSSKGGIVGFTRALAREIGPEGVTVNTIAPGAFPTDAEKIHPDPEGYNRYVLDNQSIKRRGTPDDIGNLVTFLAGDAASFITGQMIVIDGGWVAN
ncbi:MAG TPA: 3-oxoacyl-ACP reductase FabG [Thermomicrobiales bacterium]|nr:3-oxoacyl-ACP reductase FabG [Thermomicrobiales bacterium]